MQLLDIYVIYEVIPPVSLVFWKLVLVIHFKVMNLLGITKGDTDTFHYERTLKMIIIQLKALYIFFKYLDLDSLPVSGKAGA